MLLRIAAQPRSSARPARTAARAVARTAVARTAATDGLLQFARVRDRGRDAQPEDARGGRARAHPRRHDDVDEAQVPAAAAARLGGVALPRRRLAEQQDVPLLLEHGRHAAALADGAQARLARPGDGMPVPSRSFSIASISPRRSPKSPMSPKSSELSWRSTPRSTGSTGEGRRASTVISSGRFFAPRPDATGSWEEERLRREV